MRYYIADLHFFHRNLLTQMDKRGFASLEDMHEYMISQWNSRVRHGDEIVVVGDFSLGKGKETAEILKRLEGRKYLCIGNHDRNYLRDKEFDKSLFRQIEYFMDMKDNKRRVILCHYPLIEYPGMYQLREDGTPNTYMLYGHIHDTESNLYVQRHIDFVQSHPREVHHGKPQTIPGVPVCMINTFCMRSDYLPLTLDEWIELEQNLQAKQKEDSKKI